jgi:hypothetical protein
LEEVGGYRQLKVLIPLIQQRALAEEAMQKAMGGTSSLNKDVEESQKALAVQFAKVREEFLAMTRAFVESGTFRSIATGAMTIARAFIDVANALQIVAPLLAALAGFKMVTLGAAFMNGPKGFMSTFISKKAALGGPISVVPGVGNSDTVPALLTPGEYVLSKPAVQAFGKAKLDDFNAKRFAFGGIVTGNPIKDIQALRSIMGSQKGLGSYDTMKQIVKSPYREDIYKNIPRGSSFLDAGTEAFLLRKPDGNVMRFSTLRESTEGQFKGKRRFLGRPTNSEVLQALDTQIFGNIHVETLPYSPSLRYLDKDLGYNREKKIVQAMKKRLIGQGLRPTDINTSNLTVYQGKIKILDPNSFEKFAAGGLVTKGRHAYGVPNDSEFIAKVFESENANQLLAKLGIKAGSNARKAVEARMEKLGVAYGGSTKLPSITGMAKPQDISGISNLAKASRASISPVSPLVTQSSQSVYANLRGNLPTGHVIQPSSINDEYGLQSPSHGYQRNYRNLDNRPVTIKGNTSRDYSGNIFNLNTGPRTTFGQGQSFIPSFNLEASARVQGRKPRLGPGVALFDDLRGQKLPKVNMVKAIEDMFSSGKYQEMQSKYGENAVSNVTAQAYDQQAKEQARKAAQDAKAFGQSSKLMDSTYPIDQLYAKPRQKRSWLTNTGLRLRAFRDDMGFGQKYTPYKNISFPTPEAETKYIESKAQQQTGGTGVAPTTEKPVDPRIARRAAFANKAMMIGFGGSMLASSLGANISNENRVGKAVTTGLSAGLGTAAGIAMMSGGNPFVLAGAAAAGLGHAIYATVKSFDESNKELKNIKIERTLGEFAKHIDEFNRTGILNSLAARSFGEGVDASKPEITSSTNFTTGGNKYSRGEINNTTDSSERTDITKGVSYEKLPWYTRTLALGFDKSGPSIPNA